MKRDRCMKILFGVIIVVIFSSTLSFAQGNVNPSDMAQAQSFVASLPKVCGSNVDTHSDGSVVVTYSCPGKSGGVATGTIYVKDGKITKIY